MNYGELKTQFSAILNRRDCSTALAETFINQAMTRAQRDLRTPPQEKFKSYTVTDGWDGATVPDDYLKMIVLSVDDTPVQYVPYEKFVSMGTLTGQPKYWSRFLSTFKLNPDAAIDNVVNLYYYGEYSPLTSDADTNVLTESAADLIIYGALSYAADYFLDDRRDAFEARYMQIKDDLAWQAYDADGPGGVQPAYSLGEY